MTLAADHGIDIQVGDLARNDLYTADEIFVVGTAAEVSAVNSVDDRPVPCPGPATKVLADAYADLVRGRTQTYRAWNELASRPSSTAALSTIRPGHPGPHLRHDPPRRKSAGGHSLTVDDKLRIEQLDRLGVAFIEGGWPGANPKDDEFFERAKTELDLSTSTFVAFGSTRRAKGKVER